MIIKSLESFELHMKYKCFTLSLYHWSYGIMRISWNDYEKLKYDYVMILKSRLRVNKYLMIVVWNDIIDLQVLIWQYQNMNALMNDSINKCRWKIY